MSEPQTITCKAAVAWEANKPLEIVDVEVAPPQVCHVLRPPLARAGSPTVPQLAIRLASCARFLASLRRLLTYPKQRRRRDQERTPRNRLIGTRLAHPRPALVSRVPPLAMRAACFFARCV
jgi:hypothetical protein